MTKGWLIKKAEELAPTYEFVNECFWAIIKWATILGGLSATAYATLTYITK